MAVASPGTADRIVIEGNISLCFEGLSIVGQMRTDDDRGNDLRQSASSITQNCRRRYNDATGRSIGRPQPVSRVRNAKRQYLDGPLCGNAGCSCISQIPASECPMIRCTGRCAEIIRRALRAPDYPICYLKQRFNLVPCYDDRTSCACQ